jgi:hypothetical protein
MNTGQRRQPKGIRDGGQFASSRNPEATLVLGGVTSWSSLSETDQEKWGDSCEGSQAITAASAQIIGIAGYDRATPIDEDVRIAQAMLDAIAGDSGSETALYSGHNMSPERLAQYITGVTVRLPLTAVADDRSIANQFTTGEPGMRGGHDVMIHFPEGTPQLDYGADEGTGEHIVAGEFRVASVTETTDDYWGTALTVIELEPA